MGPKEDDDRGHDACRAQAACQAEEDGAYQAQEVRHEVQVQVLVHHGLVARDEERSVGGQGVAELDAEDMQTWVMACDYHAYGHHF